MGRNNLNEANLNCSEPHPIHGTDRTLNLYLPTRILMKEQKESTHVIHTDDNLSAWSRPNS
jgi:hypothetical protein